MLTKFQNKCLNSDHEELLLLFACICQHNFTRVQSIIFKHKAFWGKWKTSPTMLACVAWRFCREHDWATTGEAARKTVSLPSPTIREFKIRRLRTTTTAKHATVHDQNHVTVHFSRVVLRLRWVVELFCVVGTTENILLVFCSLGNARVSSFRKKGSICLL